MRIVCRVVADHDKNEAAMPRTMTILGSSSLWSRPARGELVVTDLLRALVRQVQHDRSAAFGADSVYWNGAPQPMKLGITRSPWRYDAASKFAQNRSNVAAPSRKHYAESA
jgi:hypothetical protein